MEKGRIEFSISFNNQVEILKKMVMLEYFSQIAYFISHLKKRP